MNIEYTFNELENENVYFPFDGKTLFSMGAPEETKKPGIFWSPAITEDGTPFDLYWERSGRWGSSEFFTLQNGEAADLG
ncbi:hypothetical protein [Treponema sp. R80B11-R83G3]